MKLHSLLVISCALCLSSVQGIPTTHAQAQTSAGERDKIKATLLRPVGWLVDWSGPGGTGQAGLRYETRGEKVVVAIELLVPPFLSCEREVAIIADGIKHDGCRDVDVTIHFDPNDPVIPFKGTSPLGYEYKFRAYYYLGK